MNFLHTHGQNQLVHLHNFVTKGVKPLTFLGTKVWFQEFSLSSTVIVEEVMAKLITKSRYEK
jgi:hypothetical protein